MKFNNLFTDATLNSIYRVIDDMSENELEQSVERTNYKFLPKDIEGIFCVSSKEVCEDHVNDCYLLVDLPERIAETVIKQSIDGIIMQSIYDQKYTIVPAVASECYGDYSLYFANEQPDIGINILKEGLIKSLFKGAIAEDLGYVLRDLSRNDEAIDAFLTSEHEGVSSEYIYLELAQLYKSLGRIDKELEYNTKFEALQ